MSSNGNIFRVTCRSPVTGESPSQRPVTPSIRDGAGYSASLTNAWVILYTVFNKHNETSHILRLIVFN